jgi:hypothetical protein
MRNTPGTKSGARAPRRSGGAGLLTVPMLVGLAVDSRKAGTPDESGAQERTSRLIPFVYHLPIDEDPEPRFVADTEVRGSIVGQEGPFGLDDMISIEEAAAALHVRRQWLVRRARRYPFIRRLSRKKFVCSRIGLIRWLRSGSNSPNGS